MSEAESHHVQEGAIFTNAAIVPLRVMLLEHFFKGGYRTGNLVQRKKENESATRRREMIQKRKDPLFFFFCYFFLFSACRSHSASPAYIPVAL